MRLEPESYINLVGWLGNGMLEIGKITGGNISFDCGLERGMGYYIMGILPIVLFGNKPTTITFTVRSNDLSLVTLMCRELRITASILVLILFVLLLSLFLSTGELMRTVSCALKSVD